MRKLTCDLPICLQLVQQLKITIKKVVLNCSFSMMSLSLSEFEENAS